MKKFLLIYGANAQAMEQWASTSKEDQEKDMQEWFTWMENNAKHFIDQGNPVGKNTRINSKGDIKEVSNEIAGYSIISAENKEKALQIIQDNPHTKTQGAYLELMEIVDMENM